MQRAELLHRLYSDNETLDRIADIPDSYILADMMEYPIGKKLPLWTVGLTY